MSRGMSTKKSAGIACPSCLSDFRLFERECCFCGYTRNVVSEETELELCQIWKLLEANRTMWICYMLIGNVAAGFFVRGVGIGIDSREATLNAFHSLIK